MLLQEGQVLVKEKPELEQTVSETLSGLQKQWEDLESTTQAKAQCLFDANRAELFTQSCSALDSWLQNISSQLQSDDFGKDLTSVNILLKKHQVNPRPRKIPDHFCVKLNHPVVHGTERLNAFSFSLEMVPKM